jgi:hypothetical protein
MTEPRIPNVTETYFDVAAKLLNLSVQPADRPAALEAFQVLMEQAALFLEFPLPPGTEAAPRFTA